MDSTKGFQIERLETKTQLTKLVKIQALICISVGRLLGEVEKEIIRFVEAMHVVE